MKGLVQDLTLINRNVLTLLPVVYLLTALTAVRAWENSRPDSRADEG